MKKFAILALAAVLVVAFTIPAAALENEFGGYWRTRFYTSGNFDGEKGNDATYRRVDTRTRLYYTAKLNDNLKLVNKFEMDATWGSAAGSRNGRSTASTADFTFVDGTGTTQTIPGQTFVTSGNNRGYGEVVADGANIEIKNSYADFNLGPVNFTVGVQPYLLFRGFAIDDDAAGVIARWKVLDNFVLAGSWLKNYEGGAGTGNNEDIDTYTLSSAFYFSENISIKPSISYARSSDFDSAGGAGLLAFEAAAGNFAGTTVGAGEATVFTYGADFDMNYDNWGLWATLIGQNGSVEQAVGSDVDLSSWLGAIGGNVMLGMFDLHAQGFYSPGDDNPLDRDIDNYFAPIASYYWSEIMGLGIFDDAASAGSPGNKIYNIWAVNIGTTVKPMDKLSVTADLWYAERDEDLLFVDPVTGLPASENKLGTELDLKVTYQLVEGLNMDLVGAYLWAGDAVSLDGNNNENPYEFGARLSLSF
jgi:hypothetical protein